MKLTAILNEQDMAKDGTYPIVIRISHKGVRKLHYTGFRAKKEWWDEKYVNRRHKDHKLVNSTIESLLSQGNQKIAEALIKGKPLNPRTLFKEQKSYYFGAYIEKLKEHYLKRGSYTMYRKMGRFKKELEECFGGDIYFEELDQEALRKLEEHMIERENKPSTRHKKFKFYSSFFNRAIQDEVTEAKNPFEVYEIKPGKVYKEKLSAEEIKILEELEVAGRYNDVRNLALFSYYCKGMRFENCITAKWSQVKKDRIHFQLVKSHKPLSVKIHSKLQAILEQYPQREYIFPFLTKEKTGLERVKQIDVLNVLVNRYLKEIVKEAEIKKKISFHNFRHSFANNLRKSGIRTDEIKDHLGHSRASITENYLQSLNDEHLDNTLENFY